jgi:O-acetyl-ADP-ribose deacetylase (regulator of RNase III)
MIEVVNFDILEHPASFIAHQCNCVSKEARGLSRAIFNKWPASNVYLNRTTRSARGSIETYLVDKNKYVINMFAQFYPGKATYTNDTHEIRERAFKDCLSKIPKSVNLLIQHNPDIPNRDIAFPFGIGCGLAGGYWNSYYSMLEDFGEIYFSEVGGKVVICKI